MPARAGLLCSVGLGDAKGVSQCWDAGLQVQLGGLGQVRILSKVVEFEQSGAALHLGLDHGGRGDLE